MKKILLTILSIVAISAYAENVTWNIVQTTDSLKDGVRVLFGTQKLNANYVMGIYDNSVSKSNIHGVEATYDALHHQITADPSYAYTVHKDGDKFYFVDAQGRYLYMYNTNKNLSASTELNNQAKWTCSVNDSVAILKSVYSSLWKILYNHNAKLFCTYSSQDSNMSEIYLYSDNAPEWKEPELYPEWTILCNKDTVKNILDWGKVVYDDTWGTEENPYQEAKTLTFATKDLTQPITLALKKGKDFELYTSSIPAKGGTATINFSVVSVGTYTDTLVVTYGDSTRNIVLKAQAVDKEEVKPAITLSTKQVYLNPNYQNGNSDLTMFTFSTTNMVKNLYVKWENTTGHSIPDRQGEIVEVLAENDYVYYGSSTNMGAVNYTDAEVYIDATAYTEGTYTSTLLFYTPDANDKSKNAFEQRVTITIEVTQEPVPTDMQERFSESTVPPITKFIHNNRLIIYRFGNKYMVNGQIIRE